MKEIKYKEEPGFGERNTLRQFDQFEQVALKGSKNRYIYELTGERPFLNIMPIINGWQSSVPSLWYGLPGSILAFITVDKSEVYGRNYGTDARYSAELLWPDTEPDNAGLGSDGNPINRELPYFNENAIGFLDNNQFGTYGTTGLANSVDFFRAGYFEISFKTDKQNCILAKGTSEVTTKGITTPMFTTGDFVETGVSQITDQLNVPTALDYPNYYKEENMSYVNNTEIRLVNGKLRLRHLDIYGHDHIDVNLDGNEFLADNKWHHVVVNFGRPGLKKSHAEKFNEKFVEFWVDGQLDKRFYENVSNKQLFYSTFKWIMGDPVLIYNSIDNENSYLDFDTHQLVLELGASTVFQDFVGFSEHSPTRLSDGINILKQNINNDLFKGTIRTIAHGINIPLDKFEIQQRYRLWNYQERPAENVINVTATIIEPKISTNKKKALKLYWNNLKENKNGIELNNNFQVESYCVTHKTKNSVSEIYNNNLAKIKTLNVLQNAKVAIKDNVLIWGPGLLSIGNTLEAIAGGLTGGLESTNQYNGASLYAYDSVTNVFQYDQTAGKTFVGPIYDLIIGGMNLVVGDRILLTGQIKPRQNGIWIFNGLDKPLSRPDDFNSPEKINNVIVYIENGYYENTYWHMINEIVTMDDPQDWNQTDNYVSNYISSEPIYTNRWENSLGEQRFFNFEEDVNISDYDLIVFMNYPETVEEIKQHFINESESFVKNKYNEFIKSLQNVCAQGSNLYVSSPKLAQDLGIIKNYELIDQKLETSDAQAAAISPFEINEAAGQYFDTHRINQYQLQTEVPGLTNKETYILTDFINYVPSNINEPYQYHAKYAYRQLGLKEGNQFFIPSLSLLKITENEKLPGFSANRKGTKQLTVVEPNQINTGTIVTKLQNTYYQNGQIVNNPYDDYATTIIVHNAQILNGQPINGKIFVNFIEDGYTMSREEYNKARIQVVPENDTNETTSTRAWQYSTTRLNRLPQRINIRELTEYGQTTPTNGGGGPLIQVPSNSSNGIIRSLTDAGNIDYQSDLYPTETEEIYPTQEIPVLSMTYLGLLWLAE